MSLLDLLCDHAVWEKFRDYKLSLLCSKRSENGLESYINEKKYQNAVCGILVDGVFPLPERSVICKMGSDKKRVVYTYPYDENTVLKLLTWLMLRKYDGIFSPALYSFRPGKTAKDAVRRLLRVKDLKKMYSYKADIHDYFNSVPVDKLLPQLKETLSDDERLFSFLSSLLSETRVYDKGAIVTEKKGIMAGTPQSSFYANLYLSGLDEHFYGDGIIYARYSDDVILFAPTEEETARHAEYIRAYLKEKGLELNPEKERFSSPDDGFTFLGFECHGNDVDIAAATLKKLKQKMRRKRDALSRWCKRSDVERIKAAKAFIRIFNRKLLERPDDNELSWANWFFPVINTSKSLHEIDLYAQDCIRYLIVGKHTKARYNARYDDLKSIGYKSLVNEYYAYRKADAKEKYRQ